MTDQILPLFSWRSAIADSDLQPTTRHVAISLSLYMNERGSSAFPGARLLAHDTGYSTVTIRTHLQLLVDEGWLELLERGGIAGQRKRANSYRATFPPPQLPLNVVDPSNPPTPDINITDVDGSTTLTHQPDDVDGSTSQRAWVNHVDPISSITLHRTLQGPPKNENASPPARRPEPQPAPRVDPFELERLMAGYRCDYLDTHAGHGPPVEFEARIRKATRRALNDGTPSEDLDRVLYVCAKENKTCVAHLLADLHTAKALA